MDESGARVVSAGTGARPTLTQLAAVHFRLGAVAFGGLGGALTLLERELVARRRWLDTNDLTDALTFTKPLPGSTVVQVVAFLGWRVRGWAGGAVAAAAFVAPAAVLMTGAAAGLAAIPDAAWLRGALAGIHVAVVGLLASALWRLARSEAATRPLTLVLLLACIAGFFVNAALVVVTAGGAGILLLRMRGSTLPKKTRDA